MVQQGQRMSLRGKDGPLVCWAHNPKVAGSNPAPATNRARPARGAGPSCLKPLAVSASGPLRDAKRLGPSLSSCRVTLLIQRQGTRLFLCMNRRSRSRTQSSLTIEAQPLTGRVYVLRCCQISGVSEKANGRLSARPETAATSKPQFQRDGAGRRFKP